MAPRTVSIVAIGGLYLTADTLDHEGRVLVFVGHGDPRICCCGAPFSPSTAITGRPVLVEARLASGRARPAVTGASLLLFARRLPGQCCACEIVLNLAGGAAGIAATKLHALQEGVGTLAFTGDVVSVKEGYAPRWRTVIFQVGLVLAARGQDVLHPVFAIDGCCQECSVPLTLLVRCVSAWFADVDGAVAFNSR